MIEHYFLVVCVLTPLDIASYLLSVQLLLLKAPRYLCINSLLLHLHSFIYSVVHIKLNITDLFESRNYVRVISRLAEFSQRSKNDGITLS
jgi:hypothetical protein